MSIDVPEPLCTIVTAAEHLNVTPRLVRKLVATGEIASVKVGRLVRITPAALSDYIAANTRNAS